jgi:hypothetical protein
VTWSIESTRLNIRCVSHQKMSARHRQAPMEKADANRKNDNVLTDDDDDDTARRPRPRAALTAEAKAAARAMQNVARTTKSTVDDSKVDKVKVNAALVKSWRARMPRLVSVVCLSKQREKKKKKRKSITHKTLFRVQQLASVNVSNDDVALLARELLLSNADGRTHAQKAQWQTSRPLCAHLLPAELNDIDDFVLCIARLLLFIRLSRRFGALHRCHQHQRASLQFRICHCRLEPIARR